MSIFGQLDAATIPTNPYWVEKGEYSAQVTKAEYRINKKKEGQRQLFIEYTIDDEDSQFMDSKVGQYFDLVDESMTQEAFSLLPSEEQAKLRKNMSALKRTLCGNETNSSQKGLGISVDDLNSKDWDPAVLVGTKVRIGVSNYGSNNEGVNVRWANLIEE